MIKAIIFDADGMVINGERFSDRFSKKFNIPLEAINVFFDKEFEDCELGKKDLKQVILPYLKEWKWQGAMDDLLKFWFKESYRVDKEVIKIIGGLREAKTICILSTNQEKYRVEFMKNEMGLAGVFDFIISSHQVGYFKDNPEFYRKLLELIPDIKTDEVLFFDDREKNIQAAESLGIKVKLYKNINDLKECL